MLRGELKYRFGTSGMVSITHAYPAILSKPIEGGIYLSLAPDCTRAVGSACGRSTMPTFAVGDSSLWRGWAFALILVVSKCLTVKKWTSGLNPSYILRTRQDEFSASKRILPSAHNIASKTQPQKHNFVAAPTTMDFY